VLDLSKIDDFAENSVAVAFDTCHKIYMIGDDTELENMRGYGYQEIVTIEDGATHKELAEQVSFWYQHSCGLRFVEFVSTNAKTGDTDFTTVIAQGEDDPEEDEE
jgi:hypothetical protein